MLSLSAPPVCCTQVSWPVLPVPVSLATNELLMLPYKLVLVNVMGPNCTVVPANLPAVHTFPLVFVVVARVVELRLDEVFTAC